MVILIYRTQKSKRQKRRLKVRQGHATYSTVLPSVWTDSVERWAAARAMEVVPGTWETCIYII